jgi:hypothetical protein
METDYNLVLNDLRILEDDMKTLKNIAVSAALAVAMPEVCSRAAEQMEKRRRSWSMARS